MIRESALLTDQYQFTMAYGYWCLGMGESEAVFHLFYRKNPFNGGFAVVCGLADVIKRLTHFQFTEEDLAYLTTLADPKGERLFPDAFLHYLATMEFSCDLQAIPEGQIVFNHEPLLRVTGPLIQCQLIETALINIINFSSLVATKAARCYLAAEGDPIIEFGLRRAQGPDGGLMASRSAYIGGCESTSNCLAGREYHIPVKGTQAHSWVMAFDDELEAFEKFSDLMPNNTLLLVDTYHTIQGIQHAIKVGEQLRARGSDLLGIRLDSGDLNTLSRQARKMLDEAGFEKSIILASGDLDEYAIAELKKQQAPIDQWGVGTRLVTAYDQPSLDAAYKLSALRDEQGIWKNKLKISDQSGKTTNPGIQQVCRYFKTPDLPLADVIYDVEQGLTDALIPGSDYSEDLLVPIFEKGCLVYEPPAIHEIREACVHHLQCFVGDTVTLYSVSLDPKLQALKTTLIDKGEG